MHLVASPQNMGAGLFNIDKSGTNKTGSEDYNLENNTRIKIRHSKYLNNVVEQDHLPINIKWMPLLQKESLQSAIG